MKRKRILSAVLAILMICSLVHAGLSLEVEAASHPSVIRSRMYELFNSSKYKGKSYTAFDTPTMSGCWAFLYNFSIDLFGVGVPSQKSATELTVNSNWYQVGSTASTNNAVLALLKTAQSGDVFQYRNSKATSRHIAMVYEVTDSGITKYDNVSSVGVRSATHTWTDLTTSKGIGDFSASGYALSLYRCTKNVVGASAKPSNASVRTNKSTYTLGETVTITPSATGATSYTMRIELDGNVVYSNYNGFTGTTAYKPDKEGSYKIFISAINSAGFVDASCMFTVIDKPSNASVHTNKETYLLGETVTITPSAKNAVNYDMGIWFGDYLTGEEVFVKSYFTGTATFTPTEAGTYTIALAALGEDGYNGEWATAFAAFTVYEESPTDKLGAYEGRFTVFDAEATEEEPRYLGTLGLGEAPEGYGYYQLSARARLTYDETVEGMYPSGGIFMLAVGAAESGAVYPTQEALANNKLVSFEGDDKFGVYGSATNYVGSMTDEEAAGIYKARYAFAVGGDISSVDEAGNRYFEFDIILRGVLAKPGDSFELKLDGWVNDGTGQISYQSSSGSISERMNVVESKSGVITIPEANGVLSFTKDDVETDAIKLLRWQGMDAEATGEPRNRGYDPTQTSDTVGIRLNGAPMAYSAANLAKAKELFKGVKYESLTHSGAVSQQVTEQADGSLTVGDKLKISFGSSGGNITATVTALKPVAMRLTMADGSECLIATPGDVNLDGSMDANDWTTIMRWTLQASSRYDVMDYPGFTLNGQSFDLWALLADMTGTAAGGSRSNRVDANDWTTIMYLTLQAWKK
ncbi:MAG: hypothetical protein IJU78_08420 [Clostridia bacterium]|nr:hypothetical protein [Clostridia bacterium]